MQNPSTLLNPEAQRFLARLYQRFQGGVEFANESLVIKDEKGRLVNLAWRQAQFRLRAAIDKQRALGKPVRIIILKSRRAGFSTGVAGEFFQATAFTPGQETLIVAHENDAAVNLFKMYNRLREHYKPFGARPNFGFPGIEMEPVLRSKQGADSGYIEWANGSSIRIATARNLEGKRSFGFRRVHLSEFAFYPDAATFMTGLMPTVPADPDTMIIIESTANGAGGEFYEMWQKASDPARESDWACLFFPYWQDEDNVEPIRGSKSEFEAGLTREERNEQTKYRLTLEQLNWRRWAIKNICNEDEDRFHQEYPGCPEEAFLTTGNPRFDMKALGRQVAKEPLSGELQVTEYAGQHRMWFQAQDKGYLQLYRRPEKGHSYIIGADTATGKDATDGKSKANRDYSVACVLDQATGEQVAVLRVRMPENLFGHALWGLGAWYNWAYIVPEITGGYGRAMLNTLTTAQVEPIQRPAYPFERIYNRRNENMTSKPSMDELGWDTNTLTRPQLISTLDEAIRDGSLVLNDAATLHELRVFINNNGRVEAQKGDHDDCVFALGLAVMGVQRAPRSRTGGPGSIPLPVKPLVWGQSARKRVFGVR